MASEVDRQRRVQRAAGRDTGRGYEPGTRVRVVSPGQAAGSAYRGSQRVVRATTNRPSSLGPKHMLSAELVLGMILVLIRIVADYEPQSNGTVKGKIGHPTGQYGPLPVAAGLIGIFFFLSFLVAKGGKWATFGNSFGALVIIALAVKSVPEANAVVATFPSWGKGNPPSGTTIASWDTTGQPAGDPLSASSPTPGGGSTQSLTQQKSSTSSSSNNNVPGSGVTSDIINGLIDTINPIKWLDGANIQAIKNFLSHPTSSGTNQSGAAAGNPTGTTNPK